MSGPTEPVVVIGTGPSGAIAAKRLSERGLDVVVLDSGTFAPPGVIVRAAGNTLFRKRARRGYSEARTAAGSSPGVTWGTSLTHGGLSNLWTAAVPRFATADFTEGGRIDERFVWPVTYDDLVDYYEAVERELVVTVGDPIVGVPDNAATHHQRLPASWQQVVAAVQARGAGFGLIPMAKGDPWMIALRGTEFSSYHCVLKPLVRAGQVHLVSGAHVTRLTWSPATGSVDGVEYVDRGNGELRHLRSRAVVVAAGTVDTTMILLRSRSDDFPDGLGNSSGVLGRYLHDHPREWWPAATDQRLPALQHPLYLARRPHDRADPLLATSHTIGLGTPRDRLLTYVGGSTRRVGVQVFGTMVPDPEFRVTIDPAAEPTPDQAATITIAYDQAAIDNIYDGRRRLPDVLSGAGVEMSVTGPFHELSPGSSYHLAGTVRMHADRRFGVLDGWNRMHDVPNVVVCDMSAFTTGPEKNPTLTAMALAMRAADRLADDLTRSGNA